MLTDKTAFGTKNLNIVPFSIPPQLPGELNGNEEAGLHIDFDSSLLMI